MLLGSGGDGAWTDDSERGLHCLSFVEAQGPAGNQRGSGERRNEMWFEEI